MARAQRTRYVRKNSSGGGWDVVKEGHIRATAHARTKQDAISEAARLVGREGGGEIRIMNRTGKVTDADTVAARKKRRTS